MTSSSGPGVALKTEAIGLAMNAELPLVIVDSQRGGPGSDAVSFSGRFSGRPFPVYVPMANVLAIYAKETGEGMMFDPEYASGAEEAGSEGSGPDDPEPEGSGPAPGGHLKVVK